MDKIFSKVIPLLLLFTSFLQLDSVSAKENTEEETSNKVSVEELTEEQKDQAKELAESLRAKQEAASLDFAVDAQEDRQVRVVIELEDRSILSEATQRGVKVNELDAQTILSISEGLLQKQSEMKGELQSQGVQLFSQRTDDGAEEDLELEADEQFTVAVNGFVTYVNASDIEKIRETSGVAGVYESIEYERPQISVDMMTSNDMVNRSVAQELGYKGEGQIIAVIDSGTDPSHPDLQNLSDETRPALTENIVNGLDVPGVYVNEKVPYAYNYYDLNNNYVDIAESSHHGQHVAGTVGANGSVEGVAPESQILGMKVFSDDIQYATTFSDVYLGAMEDAILLGADVINMSLGSPAGTYIPGSIEDVAVNNAMENGVIVSISAGNENQIMEGSDLFANYLTSPYAYPHAKNPDVGLVGSPSVNNGSISVASVDNTHTLADKIEYTFDDETGEAAVQIAAGSPNPVEALTGPQETVHIGADSDTPGAAADWEGVDVEGKVALVQRGNTFTDTLENAQNAGAVGLIVYNHAEGGEGFVNMAGGDTATIPFLFLGHNAGTQIVNAEGASITFTDEKIQSENPTAYRMSSFSSWGTTPDLKMKPEITAPGGQIYSLQNNGTYGSMSGTSMAAPQVSGGAALVHQRIKTDEIFSSLGLSDRARADLAKTLLMNTSYLLSDEYGYPYFVRQQGAGLMDLEGALTTDVVVLESGSKEPKVELGSIADKRGSFSLDFVNLSDETKYYTVDSTFLKDYIVNQDGVDLSLLSSDYLTTSVEGPKQIAVEPNSFNSPTRVTYTFDFSEDEIGWNSFVEGFVMFNPATVDEDGNYVPADQGTALQMPVLSFYGNWDEPKVIDELLQNVENEDKSTHPTFTLTSPIQYDPATGSLYFANAYDETYMNPGSELALSGHTQNFGFMATMLRNTHQANFRIVDSNNEVIQELESYQNQRKITRMSRGTTPFTFFSDALWDGMIDGEPLADNEEVYYEVEFLRTANSTPQTYRFEIVGDNTAPTIENPEVVADGNGTNLNFTSVDTGSGGEAFSVVRLDSELLELGMLVADMNFDPLIGGPAAEGYIEELEFTDTKTEFNVDVSTLVSSEEITSLLLQGIDEVGNANLYIATIDPLADDYEVVVEAPTVEPVLAHHNLVAGTAEINTTVTVALEDGEVLGEAATDAEGRYEVVIEPQTADTNLIVTAEDARGFASEPTEVIVEASPTSQRVSVIAALDGWPQSQVAEDFDFTEVVVSAVSADGKHTVEAEARDEYSKVFEALFVGEYTLTASNLPENIELIEPKVVEITEEAVTGPYTLEFATVEAEETEAREPDANKQAQIVLNEPDLLAAYNTNEIQVSGLTYGLDGISEFYAGESEIDLTQVDNHSVVVGEAEVFYGTAYEFNEAITLEDGYYEMPFKVSNGNTDEDFSIVRRFWVDTTAPEFDNIQVGVRRSDDEFADITLELSDNLSTLHLTRNGNYVTQVDDTSKGYDATDVTLEYKDTVKLKRGQNEFVYVLTDIAGNTTETTVVVDYVAKDHLANLLALGRTIEGPTLDLQRALETGNTVNVDDEVTQETVDAAAETLEAAILQNIPAILNPVITGAKDLIVEVNEEVNLLDGVKAADAFGSNLTNKITVNPKTLDTGEAGISTITYSVSDNYGRSHSVSVQAQVNAPALNTEYEPVAANLVVDLNETDELPAAIEAVANADELPEGTTFAYENVDALDLTGETADQTVVVVVTYPDETEDRVEVPVTIVPVVEEPEEQPLNEQYEPAAVAEIIVDLNETDAIPAAVEAVENAADLPVGTTYAYENADALDLTGETADQTIVVVVTYPDDSEDHVEVPFTVIPVAEEPALNDQYDPEAVAEIIVDLNEINALPAAVEAVENAADLPEDTTYTYEDADALDLTGEVEYQEVIVVVTYSDDSEDRIEVPVRVISEGTNQNDEYDPIINVITVDLYETTELPAVVDVVKNLVDLPEDTTVAYENAEDLDLTGETADQTVVVVVTYPDDSKDRIEVPVVVLAEDDDRSEYYQPIANEIYIDLNETNELPAAKDVVSNINELPASVFYKFEGLELLNQTDETTDQTVTLVAVYVDGTEDRIEVPITIVPLAEEPAPFNELYEPVAGAVTVDLNVSNKLPAAVEAVANATELPLGTDYAYENADALDLTGETADQTVIVVVTYTDGTEDRVEVSVTVIAEEVVEEAEDNTPQNEEPKEPVESKNAGQELPAAATNADNSDESGEEPSATDEAAQTVQPGNRRNTVIPVTANKVANTGETIKKPKGSLPATGSVSGEFIYLGIVLVTGGSALLYKNRKKEEE